MSGNDAGTYLRRLVKSGRITSPDRGLFAPPEKAKEVSDVYENRDSMAEQPNRSDTPYTSSRVSRGADVSEPQYPNDEYSRWLTGRYGTKDGAS